MVLHLIVRGWNAIREVYYNVVGRHLHQTIFARDVYFTTKSKWLGGTRFVWYSPNYPISIEYIVERSIMFGTVYIHVLKWQYQSWYLNDVYRIFTLIMIWQLPIHTITYRKLELMVNDYSNITLSGLNIFMLLLIII